MNEPIILMRRIEVPLDLKNGKKCVFFFFEGGPGAMVRYTFILVIS